MYGGPAPPSGSVWGWSLTSLTVQWKQWIISRVTGRGLRLWPRPLLSSAAPAAWEESRGTSTTSWDSEARSRTRKKFYFLSDTPAVQSEASFIVIDQSGTSFSFNDQR